MHHLIGLKKGYIEVIDKEKRKGRVYWKCKCSNCGKILYMRTDSLLNSNKGDCGCLGTIVEDIKDNSKICRNVQWRNMELLVNKGL